MDSTRTRLISLILMILAFILMAAGYSYITGSFGSVSSVMIHLDKTKYIPGNYYLKGDVTVLSPYLLKGSYLVVVIDDNIVQKKLINNLLDQYSIKYEYIDYAITPNEYLELISPIDPVVISLEKLEIKLPAEKGKHILQIFLSNEDRPDIVKFRVE